MDAVNQFKDSGSQERLLVTFFLFAYNQEKYIEDACKAALAQTYSPLEIIFSDDCSSDNTFKLIEEIARNYSGPHKIVLNRNQKNLGLIGHVNKSFEMSSGDLMVVAAGDDISLPDRVKRIVDVYEKHERQPMVIHSSVIKINDSNESLGLYLPPVIEKNMGILEITASQSLYIGATGAWKRSLHKDFGPIVFKNSYEDLVLGFRAAIKNSLIYIDDPLVLYRFGVGISAQKKNSFFHMKRKMESRVKLLTTSKSVCDQRAMDVGCAPERSDAHTLRKIILNQTFLMEKRLDFYKRPMALFISIFSMNFIGVVKIILSELKFLIKA